MAFDDAYHVRHAATNELGIEVVANLVKPVVPGKVLAN